MASIINSVSKSEVMCYANTLRGFLTHNWRTKEYFLTQLISELRLEWWLEVDYEKEKGRWWKEGKWREWEWIRKGKELEKEPRDMRLRCLVVQFPWDGGKAAMATVAGKAHRKDNEKPLHCINRDLIEFLYLSAIIMTPEKAMATHSSTLAWKLPMDGGAW